jgi:hypothetical protein
MLPPHNEREAGIWRFEAVRSPAGASSEARVGLSQGLIESDRAQLATMADDRPL